MLCLLCAREADMTQGYSRRRTTYFMLRMLMSALRSWAKLYLTIYILANRKNARGIVFIVFSYFIILKKKK